MNASYSSTFRRSAAVAIVLAVLLFASPVYSSIVQTATIPTGDSPSALAVNPNTHRLYSANYFGNSVSVMDGSADLAIATISVGRNTQIPNAIVTNGLSTPARAYSANFWSGTVSVIDESSSLLTATVLLGGDHGSGAPRALALDPSGSVQKLYVVEYGSGTVSVWNAETYAFIKRIAVGQQPRAVGIFSSVSHKRVFVLNRGSNTVSVIDGDTDAVVATLPVGSAPKAVAVDPSTGWAWVTNELGNSVTAIDASDTVAGTVPVGVRPIGIAVDSTAGRVFVANNLSNTVSVIRTSDLGVQATLGVGRSPWAATFDSNGGRAYVSCYASDTVATVDGALSVGSVPVGDGPYALAIDEGFSPSKVFVANRGADTVSVLQDDGLASLPIGPTKAFAAGPPVVSVIPSSVEVDPVTGEAIIEGTATSTRPFPAALLSLRMAVDDDSWREAEITEGRYTAAVRWRLRVPPLGDGAHSLRVRVLDQTAAASASSEGGASDKSASMSVLASQPFQVGTSLEPKKGAACARCHGTTSRGRRPNAPVGPARCPQAR